MATGTGTSRATSTRKARRQPLKARVSLSGPSGAGKTFSGLQIASALAAGGPIVVIDTEATTEDVGSSETYADAFDFELINWQSEWGYDPRDLEATLWDLARRPDQPAVVQIDSASHFWKGRGGTLDIAGARITGWKGARPVQDSLVDSLLRMPFHVILCTRAKMEYAIEETNGKIDVTKVGMAPIQSDDLEYEMQVALTIDHNHRIDVSKTRASVLSGKSWMANHELEFARLYADWLNKGEAHIRQVDVDALISTALAVREGDRPMYREAFKAEWGSPTFLAPDQLDAVWDWVFAATAVEPHPFLASDVDPDRCVTCDGGRSRCRWHRSDAPAPIEAGYTPVAPQDGPEPGEGTDTSDGANGDAEGRLAVGDG